MIEYILSNASPIVLSVLLIAFLIVYEFGNEKTKKIFLPFLIVLIILFAVMAIQNIYEVYTRIK